MLRGIISFLKALHCSGVFFFCDRISLGDDCIKIEAEYLYCVKEEHFVCFVIIDLKIGKVSHQDIGQMQIIVIMMKNTIRQRMLFQRRYIL